MKVLAIRHVPREGAGTIETFLAKHGVGLDYWDISQDSSRRIEECEYAAFVSLGGPMGVYEENRYPFIRKELNFLEELVRHKKPILGICLGAQLLAKTLGARVVKGPWKEIGWYDIQASEGGIEDTVFVSLLQNGSGAERHMKVFHWHGDTFELPKGAIKLAKSPLFQNQAFRYDKYVYAFQFHVEMTEDMIQEWICAGADELVGARNYIDPESILAETPFFIDELHKRAERLYQTLFKQFGVI